MNSFSSITTKYFADKTLEVLTEKMCQLNCIELVKNTTGLIHTLVPGTYIENGRLFTGPSYSPGLAFHELCHLLIVKPEHRKHMTRCTQESYDLIKRLYQSYQYLSESCTIGLQDNIQKKYNLTTFIAGVFFSGDIGVDSSIDKTWNEKANTIDHIVYPSEIKIDKTIYSSSDKPRIGSRILINTVTDKQFKCHVTPYGTVNATSFDKINPTDIDAWIYL